MREIKFRAWDDLNKYMFTHEELCFAPLPYSEVFKGKEGYPVMQYTGLKENGVEIYEGDVLKGINGNNYKVVFEDASFVLYHTNKEYGKWGLLSRLFMKDMSDLLDYIEVIGNIHEHPHLLEQQ